MATKMTANKGASIERAEIKAKIGRMRKQFFNDCEKVHKGLDNLLKFIDGMAGRASAKKGGLGRK